MNPKIRKLDKLGSHIERKIAECKKKNAEIKKLSQNRQSTYFWMHLTFAESCVLIPSIVLNFMHYVR